MALSMDEIFDIFSWLPAKSIIKLESCCKSFTEFPTETYFQLKQALNSLLKDDPCLVFQKTTIQAYSEKIEIHSVPGEEHCCGVPKNFLKSLQSTARILASSNGLFLCRTSARRGSHDETCNMSIFKWGKVGSSNQSLCLVRLRKNVFTAWVLEDYEAGSWVRVLKIRVKAMGVKEKDFNVTDFIVMNGDSLVFSTERKIYRYGLKGERYRRMEEICKLDWEGYNALTSYSNTLRPCGSGALSYTSRPPIEAGDCAATLPKLFEATEDDVEALSSLGIVPLISLKEHTSYISRVEVFLALFLFFLVGPLMF
ncbi:hypothetical protein L6164_017734 [Bauhinia variegata]|uniref:Uncharacterized protein n=1 Tax=Bauhinia variegata TaxID=167791 RepID=A0ACB9N915_BAUVA|nr:hypothetical protein L6164_017734 [Bauhinia variegata]